jgi:hypothetical protein
MDHSVLHRSKFLEELRGHTELTSSEQHLIEGFDNGAGRAITSAGNESRRWHKHEWSPTLAKAMVIAQCWKCWLAGLRNHVDLQRKCNRHERRAEPTGVPFETPDLKEAQMKLRKAQKELKQVKRDTAKPRNKHLEERQKKAAALDDAPAEKATKSAQRKEELG